MTIRAFIIFTVALLAAPAFGIEKLRYDVVEKLGPIEVRQYDAHLLAAIAIDAAFEDAGNKGFRSLFAYIDGANADATDIAMTAPVLQEGEGQRFRVAFVMPSSFDEPSLPAPSADDIEIVAVPPTRMAAIGYSGNWSKERYEKHEKRLRELLAATAYRTCGEPRWARYDPPFMPTFLRRNEVLIPVCS